MAIENETADQVVRMVLEGSEVVLKLSGEAALKVASLIYGALKGDMTTKGKATLWEFLRSGKPQKLYSIPKEYLKAFTTASKKFGFPFVVLKDKTKGSDDVDIMVYAADAPKAERIINQYPAVHIERVETFTSEVKEIEKSYKKVFEENMLVPLKLIDGIPDVPKHDKRLLGELKKYAAMMKEKGPQVVEPVRLMAKPNGRYEVIPGQGTKRIMAMRLAGYKEAVADIMRPKTKEDLEKEKSGEGRPSQERTDAPKTPPDPEQSKKESPTKEEGQTVNPTMARTSRDPASGQESGKKSKDGESITLTTNPEKRPSVRKKLEECKKISDERQSAKNLAEELEKIAPPKKPEMR